MFSRDRWVWVCYLFCRYGSLNLFDFVGTRNSATPSFANVISKAKSGENLDVPKVNEIGKKGKKPSRVLLSTASSRRY